MSYRRPMDAYRDPRRPTDSDRRASDSRERRYEGPSRQLSDHYREDERQHRDRNIAVPKRPKPPETPRDPPSAPSGWKPSSNGTPQSTTKLSTVSTSRSPTSSPGVDANSACNRLVALTKKHADAIIEVARLKAERDPLERLWRQRQADQEKSMVKHADFPSVPEIQGQFKQRHAERVRALNAQILKAREEVDRTASLIAQTIYTIAPAHNSESENKSRATTGSVRQQQEEPLEQQRSDVSELRTEIRQLEAQHSQEKEELRAEFARQLAEMKGEVLDEMRRETKKAKTTSKDEVITEMNEKFSLMREELDRQQLERQIKQQQSQQNDLRSELSKHKEEVGNQVEQQLLAQKNSSGATTNAEISAVVQQEISTLQPDLSGLLGRVDQLTANLDIAISDAATLRVNVDAWGQQVTAHSQKLDNHDARLSGVEAGDLQNVAETLFDFPILKQKVDGIQTRIDGMPGTDAVKLQQKVDDIQSGIDNLRGEVDTKIAALNGQIQDAAEKTNTKLEAVDGQIQTAMTAEKEVILTQVQHALLMFSEGMGERMDEVKRFVATQEKPVQAAADAHPTNGTSAELAAQVQQGPIPPRPESAVDSLGADAPSSLRAEHDATRAEVNRLAQFLQEPGGLSDQLNQAREYAAGGIRSANDQLESLRHQITVLDSQFNNLSTKALAEHILGQLQHVYPNARSIEADVAELQAVVDALVARMDGLSGKVEDFKAKVDGFEGKPDTSSFEGDGRSNGFGPGLKRKRTDVEMNGGGHSAMNGGV